MNHLLLQYFSNMELNSFSLSCESITIYINYTPPLSKSFYQVLTCHHQKPTLITMHWSHIICPEKKKFTVVVLSSVEFWFQFSFILLLNLSLLLRKIIYCQLLSPIKKKKSAINILIFFFYITSIIFYYYLNKKYNMIKIFFIFYIK
jgi:hypothetical protein